MRSHLEAHGIISPINIGSFLMPIPCYFYNQSFPYISYVNIILNLSITDLNSCYSCIFTQFMLLKSNQSKHIANPQKQRKKQNKCTFSPSSRSGGRVSLRQEVSLA